MEMFLNYFLIFIVYSLFGYICECIYCSYYEKKLIINRGFLLGPYLPIYGFGAIFLFFVSNNYKVNIIILFISMCILSTIIEYITSYIMEKVFKARWWDYSNKKYNINGRVCLENSVLFGLVGLFVIYVINPIYILIISKIKIGYIYNISFVLLILFSLDVIISIYTIYKIRQNSIIIKSKGINKELHDKLYKGRYFKKRMLDAFPNIKNIKVYSMINDVIKGKNKKED